jgi:pimeloyl-ACP methyl ester carboxylesterase
MDMSVVASMFVQETGDMAGRSVLLLHPLGLDHTMWRPQVEALSDCGVLAPDLPGFGRSWLESGGLGGAVDACAGLLRSRDVVAVVFGISYGGYVAALLAALHPDLVAGVALSRVRRRVPRVLAELQAVAFHGVRRRDLARGDTMPDAALAAEKRNLVAAAHELGRVDLRLVLPAITAPSVVFAPTRDRFVRREVPRVAAAIPKARIVPIAGAGHLWTQSRPEPLVDALHDLLAESS